MTEEIFVIINVSGNNTPVEYTKHEVVAIAVVNKNNNVSNGYGWYYKKVRKVQDWQEKEISEKND